MILTMDGYTDHYDDTAQAHFFEKGEGVSKKNKNIYSTNCLDLKIARESADEIVIDLSLVPTLTNELLAVLINKISQQNALGRQAVICGASSTVKKSLRVLNLL